MHWGQFLIHFFYFGIKILLQLNWDLDLAMKEVLGT